VRPRATHTVEIDVISGPDAEAYSRITLCYLRPEVAEEMAEPSIGIAFQQNLLLGDSNPLPSSKANF
jgi:hypothetical protein